MTVAARAVVCLTVDHGGVEAGGLLPRPLGGAPPAAPAALPPPQQQPSHELLSPKRQAVVDRLRRRIEIYRQRQNECGPRFDQSFNDACEQQGLETSLLQRRFQEGKAKRAAKKGDRRQPEGPPPQPPPQQQPNLQQQQQQHHPHGLTSNLHSSVHVQQKFLKRSADEATAGGQDGLSPPSNKVARNATTNEGGCTTKFSVEIVQQLEFTTSAADSQPQQISTNVTVKALTNASVKSEGAPPLLECKREPDHDFADLDQCAQALAKDAAANFPGFSDLIGDDGGDEIISDAFKDLISDISDYPFMNDFDFEDKYTLGGGGNAGQNNTTENNHPLLSDSQLKTEDPPTSQANTSTDNPIAPGGPGRGMPNRPGGYGGGELSPAAQTLKQMAEQHQHKQLGLGNRGVRSPYELHDYLTGPSAAFRTKQEPVKQEVVFPGSYKPYSPYSPGSAGHGSPGYLPRGSFSGPSPPRPSSGPPPQQTPPTSNLHINQAQHLHISQQHPSHAIQVSAGQHMHMSGELPGGNVSVAAQQGMYFAQNNTQHQNTSSSHHQNQPGNGDTYTVSQSQTINFTQQTLRQRQQQQQQQQQAQAANSSPMANNGSPMGQQPNQQNGPSATNGANLGPGMQNMSNMSNMNMGGAGMIQGNPGMLPSMGGMVGNMPGMGSGMNREQLAKLLQQQQMLRNQQAMHQQGHLRPPPPEYKASQNPMGVHGVPQPRYLQGGIRRPTHQQMPPSGPMMRPGGVVYGGAGGRYVTPSSGPAHPEWRHHLAMQQQQQAGVGFPRHPSNMSNFPHHPQHQGFPVGGPNPMQQQQQQQLHQQQLLRSQQQMMSQPHHQQQQMPSHLMAQQNQGLSMQAQASNINMNQSQSLSIHQNNSGMNPQDPTAITNGQAAAQQNAVNQFSSSMQNPTPANNSHSSFPGQPPDFNLDFLENMPSGDTNHFSDQELISSIENEYGFYLQDIL